MAFNIRIPYVIATHVKKYTTTAGLINKSKAGAIGMVNGVLYINNGSVAIPMGVSPLTTYAGDAAITLASQIAYLTKGSAAAMTVAAPGATRIGTRITITTGTDFAHVVTFTGSTLNDGTSGAKITWTAAAFKGSSITVVAVTATQWLVESKNLGTVA
jgi:hypothetical protein